MVSHLSSESDAVLPLATSAYLIRPARLASCVGFGHPDVILRTDRDVHDDPGNWFNVFEAQ